MGHPEPRPNETSTAFAILAERAGATGPQAAQLCHDLALVLDRHGELAAAEILHRRAGVLLVDQPTGNGADRQRIIWARALAANLSAQRRAAEAAAVLQAAVVLSRGLLGSDDEETTRTTSILDGIRTNYA